jgi:hypothetical protein
MQCGDAAEAARGAREAREARAKEATEAAQARCGGRADDGAVFRVVCLMVLSAGRADSMRVSLCVCGKVGAKVCVGANAVPRCRGAARRRGRFVVR